MVLTVLILGMNIDCVVKQSFIIYLIMGINLCALGHCVYVGNIHKIVNVLTGACIPPCLKLNEGYGFYGQRP